MTQLILDYSHGQELPYLQQYQLPLKKPLLSALPLYAIWFANCNSISDSLMVPLFWAKIFDFAIFLLSK